MHPLVLIEFNELSPVLLDRWMRDGHLPNFKKFYDSSLIYITKPDIAEPAYLEPWIQWYSLHTGLPYQTHNVFHLTDGPRAEHKDIWSVFLENGFSVFNCCSMNARGLEKPNSIFIPDPWCTSERAYPRSLQPFADFVSREVQNHTDREVKNDLASVVRFLAFMLTHGISRSTISDAVTQLLEEYWTSGQTAWKRAAFLDKLQLDLFMHCWQKQRPHFSSFFVNSTAHFQHAYWRHMEPEAFEAKPSSNEHDRFRDAILYGYKQMDRLLERFFALEKKGARLVFASALSQQPYLKGEDVGGHHFYRPRNMLLLLDALCVSALHVRPIMTHQFLIDFVTAEERDSAHEKFGRVMFDGRRLFFVSLAEGNSLYISNQVNKVVPRDAEIQIGNRSVPYFDLFYQLEEVKSGRHHPDGCLWFKTGEHAVSKEKVSILDLLPTILDAFGIPVSTDHGVVLFHWRDKHLPPQESTSWKGDHRSQHYH